MNAQKTSQILGAIAYKNWRLNTGVDNGRTYMQWVFRGVCAKTGQLELQHCRKWYLSPHMTESELVQTAFAAALAAEEHECREFFQYKGFRPFNPHISVDAILGVCEQEDVRAPVGGVA